MTRTKKKIEKIVLGNAFQHPPKSVPGNPPYLSHAEGVIYHFEAKAFLM
jgi:hypothetical protein